MSGSNDLDGPEAAWSKLMRAGLDGDAEAYRRLLQILAPRLRRFVSSTSARFGVGNADVEDVVQETLLAMHLKRETWMRDQPLLPWVNAIARHKLIDVARRRGRRGELPIDVFIETIPDQEWDPESAQGELIKFVSRLEGREHSVVSAITLDGDSIKDTAAKLNMSEGAVRIAFHRGLKRLAALYRETDEA